jgi:hypothetical protein
MYRTATKPLLTVILALLTVFLAWVRQELHICQVQAERLNHVYHSQGGPISGPQLYRQA